MHAGHKNGRCAFAPKQTRYRILEVVPKQWTKPKRRLIVFATPNGKHDRANSTERRPFEGRDCISIFSTSVPSFVTSSSIRQTLISPCHPAIGPLSWPAFRQNTDNADKQIRRLIESLQTDMAADETYLTCHSGGGSLIWGWMKSYEHLPESVTRIALLDAIFL